MLLGMGAMVSFVLFADGISQVRMALDCRYKWQEWADTSKVNTYKPRIKLFLPQ